MAVIVVEVRDAMQVRRFEARRGPAVVVHLGWAGGQLIASRKYRWLR